MERNINRTKRWRRNVKKLDKRTYKAVSNMIDRRLQQLPEKKFFDTTINGIAVSSTASLYHLSPIPTGNFINQKIGLEVDVQSIFYRLQFRVGDEYNVLRFVIFQCLDEIGGDPVYSEIFQYPTGITNLVATESALYSPLNLSTTGTRNFKIILDKHIRVVAGQNNVEILEGYINKGYNKRVSFVDTTLFGINHLYMLVVSDSGSISHPSIGGVLRLRYTDA